MTISIYLIPMFVNHIELLHILITEFNRINLFSNVYILLYKKPHYGENWQFA